MALNGDQFKQLQSALLSAFPSIPMLKILVKTELNQNLDEIAVGNLSEVVFALIVWAEANGRLEELVQKASLSNPGNPELHACAESLLSQHSEPENESAPTPRPDVGGDTRQPQDSRDAGSQSASIVNIPSPEAVAKHIAEVHHTLNGVSNRIIRDKSNVILEPGWRIFRDFQERTGCLVSVGMLLLLCIAMALMNGPDSVPVNTFTSILFGTLCISIMFFVLLGFVFFVMYMNYITFNAFLLVGPSGLVLHRSATDRSIVAADEILDFNVRESAKAAKRLGLGYLFIEVVTPNGKITIYRSKGRNEDYHAEIIACLNQWKKRDPFPSDPARNP